MKDGIVLTTQENSECHDWPYYYLAMDMYFGCHSNAQTVLPSPDTPESLALYEKIVDHILQAYGLKNPFIWESDKNQ